MNEEKTIHEMEKHLPYEVFKMLGQYMSQRTVIDVACSLEVRDDVEPTCTDIVIKADK